MLQLRLLSTSVCLYFLCLLLLACILQQVSRAKASADPPLTISICLTPSHPGKSFSLVPLQTKEKKQEKERKEKKALIFLFHFSAVPPLLLHLYHL